MEINFTIGNADYYLVEKNGIYSGQVIAQSGYNNYGYKEFLSLKDIMKDFSCERENQLKSYIENKKQWLKNNPIESITKEDEFILAIAGLKAPRKLEQDLENIQKFLSDVQREKSNISLLKASYATRNTFLDREMPYLFVA